jgi:hypothetical protein
VYPDRLGLLQPGVQRLVFGEDTKPFQAPTTSSHAKRLAQKFALRRNSPLNMTTARLYRPSLMACSIASHRIRLALPFTSPLCRRSS